MVQGSGLSIPARTPAERPDPKATQASDCPVLHSQVEALEHVVVFFIYHLSLELHGGGDLSGHGNFDMKAYEDYLARKLTDYEHPEEAIKEALKKLAKVG